MAVLGSYCITKQKEERSYVTACIINPKEK
jgi:hypothetical protein